jgi:hypothetical protein
MNNPYSSSLRGSVTCKTELVGFWTLSIVRNSKYSKTVSETGSVSVLKWEEGGKTPTLLDPLERASLNHWNSSNSTTLPIRNCAIKRLLYQNDVWGRRGEVNVHLHASCLWCLVDRRLHGRRLVYHDPSRLVKLESNAFTSFFRLCVACQCLKHFIVFSTLVTF